MFLFVWQIVGTILGLTTPADVLDAIARVWLSPTAPCDTKFCT